MALRPRLVLVVSAIVVITANIAHRAVAEPEATHPWMDLRLSAEARAARLVAAMTLDEKIGLLHTRFGVPMRGAPKPPGALDSAGFTPGVPRLGLPPLQETDAELGIANPTNASYDATPLPSGLAMAATFDPTLAAQAGAMIGGEARGMGFSVLLGGGANLTRDPRGGRDFEYAGEDPLLTGAIVGSEIAGTQSRRIVSTLKHFAINAQENGRVLLSSDLSEAAARESDLLAFELALERGRPGAVMTGYNRVNGTYASENAALLNGTLKGDWGFAGWVMSDWSATHSTQKAALAGLDQESGVDNDTMLFFGPLLAAAVASNDVPMARLDDMARRIVRAQIETGVLDHPPQPGGTIDFAADAETAKRAAEQAIVLLKNANDVLPLKPDLKRILVVGGHADQGVLSGGGSSQVVPRGAIRAEGEPTGAFWGKPMLYDPSSPLDALKRAMPGVAITFLDGQDVTRAAHAARDADVAIVFAEQWMNESRDMPDLALPHGQDALIAAVAALNRRTLVVLETGGPVTMPWLGAVAGVVEAWYPGARGGDAIAEILTGQVDPSGHLPITFPASEAQLPRPIMTDPASTTSNPGSALKGPMFSVDYDIEGADVGYKWHLRTARTPLFPFGYGLSYTRFAVDHVRAVAHSDDVSVSFDVANKGRRAGIATPQVYVDGTAFTRRLAAFDRVALRPGEMRRVTLSIDRRLLARFDGAAHGWHIAAGRYTLAVRANAMSPGPKTEIILKDRAWPAKHRTDTAGAMRLGRG